MKNPRRQRVPIGRRVTTLLLGCGLVAAFNAQADTVTINVVDNTGASVSGFRYLVQEDTTFAVDPEQSAGTDRSARTTSCPLSFHASNRPVAKAQSDASGLTGNTDGSSVNITSVPPGRYYVSVLPYSGHAWAASRSTVCRMPTIRTRRSTVTVTVQHNRSPPRRSRSSCSRTATR